MKGTTEVIYSEVSTTELIKYLHVCWVAARLLIISEIYNFTS